MTEARKSGLTTKKRFRMAISENNIFTIYPEDPDSPDALELIRELDEELLTRYPATSVHVMEPSEADTFVIARIDGHAVGCGALRNTSERTGEIKRMFVRPDHRGRGIARKILKMLELAALEIGYIRIRLETGDRQPESIGLYESADYYPIPRFGEYTNDPHSRCFEKYCEVAE